MRALAQRRGRPATALSVDVPAPIGGINTVDAASAMPATDCIYAYNLVSGEYGLRSRVGWREWCTGLTGGTAGEVPSVIPFSGSHKNGSTDKLFGVTPAGIFDCSSSTASPSQLVTFSTQTGDAGNCSSAIFSTAGGRFLLLCDEENGLFLYSEASATWSQATLGTTQAWASSTLYALGNKVTNGGNVYTCSLAGTSASSGGPSGTSTGIVDGSAHWDYVSAASASVIGPSLADQNLGYTADPSLFAYVTTWKSRVWLVEKDTSRAWYLGAGAVYGTATSFDFGGQFKSGGVLLSLHKWSYDGGGGLDTLLVAASGAGDVVGYQGTDPTSSSTFGIKGSWFVGGFPYGRRVAKQHGGDILLLSTLGPIPLSELVAGKTVEQASLATTRKVRNLFNLYVSTRKTLRGWAMDIHPTENVLMVTVPANPGEPTIQFVMSLANGAWFQFRDLPILSMGVWNGQLYFGTTDGRLCINDGYVDARLLSDASSYTPVKYSLLTSFQSLGNARNKQVVLVRPTVFSDTPNADAQATVRYGYNLIEPDAPTGSGTSGSGTWDSAVWDADVWGGEYTPTQKLQGASGMGREVALALRGNATSRTTIVGFNVVFEVGGLL
jgi:hypothetical protein